MFHLYDCSRLFTTSAMHCDSSQQVRTRCCERSFVNTPRRTTIRNRSQLFPTNVNTPMRTTLHNYSQPFTTVPNQCEHANCATLFTTIRNRSQLFPTNVNTPMRTTIRNRSQPFTTLHNYSFPTNVNTPMRTTVHKLFKTVRNSSQLNVNQPYVKDGEIKCFTLQKNC